MKISIKSDDKYMDPSKVQIIDEETGKSIGFVKSLNIKSEVGKRTEISLTFVKFGDNGDAIGEVDLKNIEMEIADEREYDFS